MKTIDKGLRATNYLIDLAVILFVLVVLMIFFGLHIFFYYVILFSYYFFMELILGQTLGKVLTKTKVVRKDGTKPQFLHILSRSFWRLMPLDVISYLFGYERGMHDIFSFTRLKKL